MSIFRRGHCWKQPSVVIHGCRYTDCATEGPSRPLSSRRSATRENTDG